MFKKIVSFIKYHNAASIGISLVLVLSFSAMASNDVRDAVLGEKIVIEQGVDNSALLAADLENFDLAMEITNVMEDPEPALTSGETGPPPTPQGEPGNYYIDYQYATLGIQDDVWHKILRQKQMVVSKAALAGRDLGLYVSEELGEIIDNEIAYLKEVQKNEEEKGQTFAQETTKYTGLIGLVLDTKTKELPGYEPVVKPPEIVVQPETAPIIQPEPINPTKQDGSTQSMEPTKDYDGFAGAPENGSVSADSPYYLWLVKNCMDSGKYWYNETCNAEAEIIPTPAAAPLAAPESEAEDLGDEGDEGEKGNEGDLILN